MPWKYLARCAAVGCAALLGSLATSLPVGWLDLESAVIAGGLAALTYAGVGYATPLEPSIGKK